MMDTSKLQWFVLMLFLDCTLFALGRLHILLVSIILRHNGFLFRRLFLELDIYSLCNNFMFHLLM